MYKLILLFMPLFSFAQEKVIDVPILNVEVIVYFDSASYVSEGYEIPTNADCQTTIDSGLVEMYLPKKDCLDHELIHATWYILDAVGISIDSGNNEIQAYLFEYLKKEILKP